MALGPVLARLSTEYAGKFLLARIDIDTNPQLAQAVGVQTVPLVIAVLRGQVVPLFQGAVGEPEARQYVDQLLTVAVANGITGRADPVGPADAVSEDEEEPPPTRGTRRPRTRSARVTWTARSRRTKNCSRRRRATPRRRRGWRECSWSSGRRTSGRGADPRGRQPVGHRGADAGR